MNAEIISIGTEIMLGEITDTNSTFIAQELTNIGCEINYIINVADKKEQLQDVLHKASDRSDIIITSGGLGPTADDITREVVSKATGNPLYEDKDLRKEIENYFHEKGYNLTPNNYRQAYLPRGAEPIINEWGTAPGILLEQEDTTIISLPGVPDELESMLKEKVIPYLYKKQNIQTKTKYLKFFGIG